MALHHTLLHIFLPRTLCWSWSIFRRNFTSVIYEYIVLCWYTGCRIFDIQTWVHDFMARIMFEPVFGIVIFLYYFSHQTQACKHHFCLSCKCSFMPCDENQNVPSVHMSLCARKTKFSPTKQRSCFHVTLFPDYYGSFEREIMFST